MERFPPAPVIFPKLVSFTFTFGLFSCHVGEFVSLNASARNSRFQRSVNRKLLNREASRFAKPGPLAALRPTLPKVFAAGAEKTLVSNQGESLIPPTTRNAPLMFGVWPLPGAFVAAF